jgi:hypothetical protein
MKLAEGVQDVFGRDPDLYDGIRHSFCTQIVQNREIFPSGRRP